MVQASGSPRTDSLHDQDGAVRPVHHALRHAGELRGPRAAGPTTMRSALSSAAARVIATTGSDATGCVSTGADSLSAISRNSASSSSTESAGLPPSGRSSEPSLRRARFDRNAVTMCSVPPEARATRWPRRTAGGRGGRVGCTDDDVLKHAPTGPCSPREPSRRKRDRERSAAGPGTSTGRRSRDVARRGDQHGHVCRLGQLLADASAEALVRDASRFEAEDDEISPERLCRFGDAADQSLVAYSLRGTAHGEVVRQLASFLAHVGDDLTPPPRGLVSQLDEPDSAKFELPRPIAHEHERGPSGIRAIHRNENLLGTPEPPSALRFQKPCVRSSSTVRRSPLNLRWPNCRYDFYATSTAYDLCATANAYDFYDVPPLRRTTSTPHDFAGDNLSKVTAEMTPVISPDRCLNPWAADRGVARPLA